MKAPDRLLEFEGLQLIDIVLLHKTYYLPVCHVPQWYYLGPLGEIISSNQYKPLPLDDSGCISPMKSSPHTLNGHGYTIECITPAGANCIFPNL
jgi:hypothetical protein